MASENEVISRQTAFQLKGSLFTLTILQLGSPDPDLFSKQLSETVKKAPNFFKNVPIVVDLQKLSYASYKINFNLLNDLLRNHSLIPVGVCGGNEKQQADALEAGFAILPVNKQNQTSEVVPEKEEKVAPEVENKKPEAKSMKKSADKAKQDEKPTAEKPKATIQKSKIIVQPVRSGQQIYAKDADLIVLAPVSHGAELLADGNIHVYGSLRGRALAGINGDKNARIFCKELDAELVSIAGLYQLSDEKKKAAPQKNVQVYVEADRLQFSEL